MLLKQQEQDNKIKSIYASSNICASIYDKSTNNLTIIFNNGGQYLYEGVSNTDNTRFEMADSQGAIFNSHIKKYPFKKLDKIDVKEILSEVTKIKDSESKVKIDYAISVMIDKMKALITYYDTAKDIESNLLNKTKEAILEYDNAIAPKLDKVNG
jgi:hypothetical protein|tara:strand:+ start:3894 stop:4358 length:465 start_codon:yes stop_codon:yes gene_type:complete